MAYNYLDEKQLKDATEESIAYVKEFHRPLDEIKRVTDGKPGKVPKGKPRVTDGTLAGWKRETPKQVVQQLPTGRVILSGDDQMEAYSEAILSDVILANANGGGTPYDKAILSIEDVIDAGSSWAYCYFDRRGDILHANYRLKNVKDLLFEKGKVSEFDSNFMGFYEWLTKTDINARIAQYKNNAAAYKERGCIVDLKAWQALLDAGPEEKQDENKTEEEKKQAAVVGYYKVIKWMQIGTAAKFFTYDPRQDKVLTTEVNKDPRGVIPLHGLVGAPSRANPLGRPLAQISLGKQNLLDFRMQMEQYREGMSISPPTKLWGSTPESRIKLVPDKVIKMNGTPATDDLQVVDLTTSDGRDYANDSSYIRTQIYNEQGGSNDTSVGAPAGSVGFSKTDSGVKQQQARTSVSKDHLRRLSEQWHGRIFETLLNIHFAESKGSKVAELEPATLKRLGLDKSPVIDYEKQYGPMKFKVIESSSQKLSDADQAANMQAAAGLVTPQVSYYLGQDGWKFDLGEFYSNLLRRLNIDNMDKILTKMNDKEAEQAKQQPFPIIDPPQIRINTADLTSDEIVGVLGNAGVNVAPRPPAQPGQPPSGLSPQGQADFMVEMLKAQSDAAVKQAQAQAAMQPQQTAPEKPAQQPKTLGESVAWKPGDLKPTERAQALLQVGIQAEMSDEPTPNEITQATDTATRIDKHAHDTTMQVVNQAHTQEQAQIANAQADRSQELAETTAQKQADGQLEEARNG